ncbi:hypothetical protein AALC75_19775 [Lachnospiraceae bacterium 48-42]
MAELTENSDQMTELAGGAALDNFKMKCYDAACRTKRLRIYP